MARNKSFNCKYVSVVKSATNSKCAYCVVAQVNTSICALNSSADFEKLSQTYNGPAYLTPTNWKGKSHNTHCSGSNGVGGA